MLASRLVAVGQLFLLGRCSQEYGAQIASGDVSNAIHEFQQVVCTKFDVMNAGKVSGEDVSNDHEDVEELIKACSWVAQYMNRRDLEGTMNESPDMERRLHDEEPEDTTDTSKEDHLPWYIHPQKYGYPWTHGAFLILVMTIIVVIWEILALQSTTCLPEEEREEEKKPSKTEATSWGTANVHEFWRAVETWGEQPGIVSQPAQQFPVVRFNQRRYRVVTDMQTAKIAVERTGPCRQELRVKVKTFARAEIAFSASSDVFEDTEKELVFAPGQSVQLFEVPIKGDQKWDAGSLFLVKLTGVISGIEVLLEDHASVFVVDSHRYPGNAPENLRKTLRMTRYFWKECYNIRGCKKITKTFVGMLYKPVQSVVVTSVVTKLIIDKATGLKDSEENMRFILILAAIQFASWLVERWADQLQTQNRGRTGGIRQTHRRWLFDKLMFTGRFQHWTWKLSASEWFYAAQHDVDSITTDVYWQVYVIAQNLFALFLSLVVLISMDFRKAAKKGVEYEHDFLPPSLLLVLLVPLSAAVSWFKKPSIIEHVKERTLAEAGWMDYWSWLAHSNKVKYGYSYREISSYEKLWGVLNDRFTKEHQLARDWMNDSNWVTEWMCHIAYMTMLVWGAFALTATRNNDGATANITAGEYSVLLTIYSKVGGYLIKLNDSILLLFRGQVSLFRVQKLLNTGMHDKEIVLDDVPSVANQSDTIQVLGVHYDAKGIGEFGKLHMLPGARVEIPLGAFVHIHGDDEAAVLTFMALIGGMFLPDSGKVSTPGWVEIITASEMPAESPGCLTVHQEIMLIGACNDEQAERLAHVFDLDPSTGSHVLLPASRKVLDFIKVLLRPADVIILARPFAFVQRKKRPLLVKLLRIWQNCGGAAGILSWLSDGAKTPPKVVGPRRTVITFALGPKNSLGELPTDVNIDLDKLLDKNWKAPAAKLAPATRGGYSNWHETSHQELLEEEETFDDSDSSDGESSEDDSHSGLMANWSVGRDRTLKHQLKNLLAFES